MNIAVAWSFTLPLLRTKPPCSNLYDYPYLPHE
jgi:hypothetical protein